MDTCQEADAPRTWQEWDVTLDAVPPGQPPPPPPPKGAGGPAPAICGALSLPVSLPFQTASERTQVGVREVLKVASRNVSKDLQIGSAQMGKVRPSPPLACATSQKVTVFIHLQCHKGHSGIQPRLFPTPPHPLCPFPNMLERQRSGSL